MDHRRLVEAKKTIESAILIQCSVRSFQARRKCALVAHGVIEKIVDPKSKRVFYFNRRYETSRWTAPLFLRLAKEDLQVASLIDCTLEEDAATFVQAICRGSLVRSKMKKNMYGGFQRSKRKSSQSQHSYKRPRSKQQMQIDKALGFPTDVEITLDLSDILMNRLSSRLFDLAINLVSLNLSRCRLNHVGSNIGKLLSLVSLNMSNNCLLNIPSEIDNLKSLKSLDISHNKIRSFPRSFCALKIEELDVSFNRFQNPVEEKDRGILCDETVYHGDGLVLMHSLRRLDARYNRLELLPEGLEICSNLKVLDVSDNSLKMMDRICQLPNLEVINLAGNRLQALPAQFGVKMTSVIDLNLERNQIGAFPDQLTGWKRNLKVLNMSENILEDLPESLGYLVRLREFFCRKNLIQNISSTVGTMKCLEKLDLSSNNLSKVPTSFSQLRKLKELSLANNKFDCIPQELEQLFCLEDLDMMGNQVTGVGGLGKLLSIRRINLSQNKIEYLAPGLFEATTLNELLLSSNELRVLPVNVENLKKLEVLDLSHNKLDLIPETISNISSLERLGLSFNQLNTSGVSIDMKQLSKLTTCTFHSNRIGMKPDSFRGVNRMKHLNFNDNAILADDTFVSSFHRNVVRVDHMLHATMSKEDTENQNLISVLEKARNDVDLSADFRDIRNRTIYTQYFCLGVVQQRRAFSCMTSTGRKMARRWAQKAIDSFNIAERVWFGESNPELYYSRARCHEVNENFACAISDLERVLSMRSDHFPSLYARTILLEKVGMFTVALQESVLLLRKFSGEELENQMQRLTKLHETVGKCVPVMESHLGKVEYSVSQFLVDHAPCESNLVADNYFSSLLPLEYNAREIENGIEAARKNLSRIKKICSND